MNTFKFGGKIDWNFEDDHRKIILIQPDGEKIDLIKRFSSLDELSGYKPMQVNYYISDNSLTEQELLENHILNISGAVTAEYTEESYHYSSWTSGTDYYSTLEVGGHDLFNELSEHDGKYIFFKINTL